MAIDLEKVKELSAGMSLQSDGAWYLSQLADEVERLREQVKGSTQLSRHRDQWRGYAYGKRDRPSDFLCDQPSEVPTEIDRLQKAPDTIAGGHIDRFPGAPDITSNANKFRGEMWSWSQKVARAALPEEKPLEIAQRTKGDVMEIQLGDRVEEKISGYEGIVIGKTEWIYGCVRFGVQTEGLHEGKPIEAQWFDSGELTVVEKRLVGTEPQNDGQSTGGPPRKGVETG